MSNIPNTIPSVNKLTASFNNMRAQVIKAAAERTGAPSDPNEAPAPAVTQDMDKPDVRSQMAGTIHPDGKNAPTGDIALQGETITSTEEPKETRSETSATIEEAQNMMNAGLAILGAIPKKAAEEAEAANKAAEEEAEKKAAEEAEAAKKAAEEEAEKKAAEEETKKAEVPESETKAAEPTATPAATPEDKKPAEEAAKEAGVDQVLDQAGTAVGIFSDTDVTRKLACIGSLMLSSEEGMQAVNNRLAFIQGVKAASEYTEHLQKTIKHAHEMQQHEQHEMQKVASYINAVHADVMSKLPTEAHKIAYAMGAQEADEAAAMMAAEQQDVNEQLSMEEVVQLLQYMVQNGEMPEEKAQAILQALELEGAAAMELEQLVAELEALIQQQVITVEEAEAILNEIMAVGGAEAAPAAGAEEAAAAEAAAMAADPAKQASAQSAQITAHANHLLQVLASK